MPPSLFVRWECSVLSFESFPRFRSCSNSVPKLRIDYNLVGALICCLSEYKPNLSCSLRLFEREKNTVLRTGCYSVHNELGFSKLKLIRWIQLSTLGTTGTIVPHNFPKICGYIIQAIKWSAASPLYIQGCHRNCRHGVHSLHTKKSVPMVRVIWVSVLICRFCFIDHAGWKPYGLCPCAYYWHGRYALQPGLFCVRYLLSVLVSCWSTVGENYHHR